MPLALGLILAFVLTPLVRLFDRLRLPRFVGVILTMTLALGAVGAIGYVTWVQFAELSTQVTQYTSSMRRKVADLRLGQRCGASSTDAHRGQSHRAARWQPRRSASSAARARRAAAHDADGAAAATRVEGIFEPIASAVIVLVLVMFMLGQREDLRDRFIRLDRRIERHDHDAVDGRSRASRQSLHHRAAAR